ncbi:N-acetylglutaminylglutamine synthetase [Marinobacterium jannaschii]|uniref:N-acetylglutaminylglutamine synthetase n=1 Tax=Marinobacterium jannaschii TaxID=64970 RepID=UPI0005632B7E|nr:N-acetylglutaminylglutamine synthetase [Marinobacterium jannaschii]
MNIEGMASLKNWGQPPGSMAGDLRKQAVVDCGWGRLIFGQTFHSSSRVAEELCNETPGRRDVSLYIRDPQVVVAKAPQELFIDPSLTFRIDLAAAELPASENRSVRIRPMQSRQDERAVNRIYQSHSMVPLSDGFYHRLGRRNEIQVLLAVDPRTDKVVGCVTGVDHRLAFSDPDNGASLWALASDDQSSLSGIEEALVGAMTERFQQAGRAFMDLSIMHDNEQAIALYSRLGFYQVPVYGIKTRNAVNTQLYIGAPPEEELNNGARIIVDEAARRGISVDVVDAAGGYFDLSLGSRTISCRESLTDLTSAVALSRCDDKSITLKFLRHAGLNVPEQALLKHPEDAQEFLHRHRRIVIKPVRGENGQGVFVDLKEPAEVEEAFIAAAAGGEKVIGERFVRGQDLRILVINNEVVAAALRSPASVMGDGMQKISSLISKQSRRRKTATQGESNIPLDAETERCVAAAGFSLDDILPYGQEIQARKTANLHTGGTLRDITSQLHPTLIDAALRGAAALDMPLVGLDFIVNAVDQPEYVILEANERPGLANHEPQPTAEKMIDMLFPHTASSCS